MPDIAILVLTYNRLEVTKKFLNLLYLNTSIPFHLFILDNGSSDGTPEYLRNELFGSKDNLQIFLEKNNLGIVKGRNKLITEAMKIDEIDKVLILDNDQYVNKNWINNHLSFLNLGYDLVGIEGWQMRSDFYPFKKNKNQSDFFSYTGCGGMLIKREVIDKIGLFDERFFQFFEDPDFNFRAFEYGFKIGWNYNPIITHLPHKLLNKENRKHFFESWEKFKKKWSGRRLFKLRNIFKNG